MTIRQSLYAIAGVIFCTVAAGTTLVAGNGVLVQDTFAAPATGDAKGAFGQSRASELNKDGSASGQAGLTKFITNMLYLVTLIAVGFIIWAGFQVLTAGGDEEKLKKGKAIIIQVIIGIIVMWLAWSIVGWILSALSGSAA